MSMLLGVVQATVAPVATATPIIVEHTKEIVTTVPAVTPELMKGAQLALLFLLGIGGSILHQIIERGRWSSNTNRVVLWTYGLLIAVLGSFVAGDLKLTAGSALDLVTNFLLVLGSAEGRYNFNKWVNSIGTSNVVASPIEDQIETTPVPVKASV